MLSLAGPRDLGLGLGDMKLAVVIGLLAGWLSWPAVFWSGVVPFLLTGLAAVVLLVSRRAGRHAMFAFGPFMLVGAVVVRTWARAIGFG